VCHSAQTDCGCDLLTPARGRHFVTETLTAALGADGISATDHGDIELIATELLTNASRVCSGSVLLELTLHRKWIQVAVTDDGPGWPTPRVAAPTDERGRGLAIVSTLASSWGVEHHDRTKTVWARLSVGAELPFTVDCDTPDPA
jgi:anti-sigma regulatory factor (Ser/Thr protein kinase)